MTAEKMARLLHAGQKDKAGKPYVEHLERVAAMVPAIRECKAAAWLHDAVEDGHVTHGEILTQFGAETALSVFIVTRAKGEAYADYICRVAESDCLPAIMVKMADLRDHLDHRDKIPDSLVRRYVLAHDRLDAALRKLASRE